jgi:RHS repeat-associated protein
LTNLSGQALLFDADGNLISDGQRNYSWDAENRVVGIAYPSQPGKATAFSYDGLGRRTAIMSTPTGGGSTVTSSYIWCGARLCQARNASNAPTRGYYSEGEFVPGSPAQPYYYGSDQIGSARRVFAGTISAPAYGYDAYGNALQTTALLTDFGYAGMFFNADSGLYLTPHRPYDPVSGRWLSRDPTGEKGDPAANLYAYVGGTRSDSLIRRVSIPRRYRNPPMTTSQHVAKHACPWLTRQRSRRLGCFAPLAMTIEHAFNFCFTEIFSGHSSFSVASSCFDAGLPAARHARAPALPTRERRFVRRVGMRSCRKKRISKLFDP